MAPIDATLENPFPGSDPIRMLRAMTMAFMVLLSKQPNMAMEFSHDLLRTFPYEDFRLATVNDENSQSFLLIREEIEIH